MLKNNPAKKQNLAGLLAGLSFRPSDSAKKQNLAGLLAGLSI
jgi:hypothetical protein